MSTNKRVLSIVVKLIVVHGKVEYYTVVKGWKEAYRCILLHLKTSWVKNTSLLYLSNLRFD